MFLLAISDYVSTTKLRILYYFLSYWDNYLQTSVLKIKNIIFFIW